MKLCIDIGACAEGAKALARQGGAKELKRIEEGLSGAPGDKIEIMSNVSHVGLML